MFVYCTTVVVVVLRVQINGSHFLCHGKQQGVNGVVWELRPAHAVLFRALVQTQKALSAHCNDVEFCQALVFSALESLDIRFPERLSVAMPGQRKWHGAAQKRLPNNDAKRIHIGVTVWTSRLRLSLGMSPARAPGDRYHSVPPGSL